MNTVLRLDNTIFKNFEISSLRIFGSLCRDEWNEDSDIDVLCVGNLGTDQAQFINRTIQEIISPKASLSFYREERVSLMFEYGHLFGWHLYNESYSLLENDHDFIARLGKPNSYVDSEKDIRHFVGILNEVKRALQSRAPSLTFEAGILYLCLRNIALSASWTTNCQPDFSKLSPYKLNTPAKNKLFISQDLYLRLMSSRHSSTRGGPGYTGGIEELRKATDMAISWTESILNILKEADDVIRKT